MSASPHTPPSRPAAGTPLPAYFAAAVVCLVLGSALGYGAWLVFTNRRAGPADKPGEPSGAAPQRTPSAEAPPAPSPAPPQQPTPSAPAAVDQAAPAGFVAVAGGEVLLGGAGTNEPVQKAYVTPFYISETEVTNSQYDLFVKATGHAAPAGWRRGEFQAGTAQEPVTGVTWRDASDYCGWLGQGLNAVARLPTEPEWARAARGDQNYKYPWGNEWRDGAAASRETRVRAVKSYPGGASPFGAYDMAGNVWEWVADDGELRIQDGEGGQTEVIKGKVVKGGAALEKTDKISAVARDVLPADEQNGWLGFRCVVPGTR